MHTNIYKEHLSGKVITEIRGLSKDSDIVTIHFADGSHLSMYHSQDCCESVTLEDFDNDAETLIGSTMLKVEECISNSTDEEYDPLNDYDYSYTWTFYTIFTSKGIMKLRWYGTSNGWYSEDVTLSITYPDDSIVLNY